MKSLINYPFEVIPEEGTVIEVAPSILWMRLPLPMRLDHVNVFALDEGDSWTIVDTGFDTKSSREVWNLLLKGPLKGKPVRRVIVTHYHPDHIGLAGWFQSEHGAELVTTRTSWLMARMLVLDEQMVATPESLMFYKRAGLSSELYEEKKKERPFNFSDVVSPLPQGYTRIKEGDSIVCAGRTWRIRIGNGHAPEHATLWSEGIVLGGDQLLPSISPNLGVYANEPEADPVSEWLETCQRLKAYASSDQLILPGHKLPFTGLPTRIEQLSENHYSVLERLTVYLQKPSVASECFLPLFKREISGSEYGMALAETIAHLNHLYLVKKISRRIRSDGAHEYRALTL